jgi:hypothetical protein
MKNQEQKSAKKLVPMAEFALKHEFYLDAVIILSRVMEARLRTIITRIDKSHPGTEFTLEQCIKRVKFLLATSKDPILTEHFELSYLDELRAWKNHRNAIFKTLPDTHVSKYRMEKLAKDGLTLLARLIVSYKKFKKDWQKSLVKVPA